MASESSKRQKKKQLKRERKEQTRFRKNEIANKAKTASKEQSRKGANKQDRLELATARAKKQGVEAPKLDAKGNLIYEKEKKLAFENFDNKKEKEMVKDEQTISKNLNEKFITTTDDAGNVKKIPMDLALEMGIVEGVTGREQNKQLINAGILGAGATPGALANIGNVGLKTTKETIDLAKLKTQFPNANNKVLQNVMRKVNNAEADEIIKILIKKPLVNKKALIKFGGFVGASALGADLITTWYALDNVASGGKFTIGDAMEAIETGTRTPNEIKEYFDNNDKLYNAAVKKVELSTSYNPFMWASAKLLMDGVLQDRETYLIKRDNFIQSQGGQTNDN